MDELTGILHALGLPVAAATIAAGIIMIVVFVGPRLLHALGVTSAAEARAEDETRMRDNMEGDIDRLRTEAQEDRERLNERLNQCEEMHRDCERQLGVMRKRVVKLETKKRAVN